MAIQYASHIINCGYARVCIYQNSDPSRRGKNARQGINFSEREEKFKAQFTHPTYSIPANYFTPNNKDHHRCQFDRDCAKILDGFKMKFMIGNSKESYLREFSLQKWAELSSSEKEQHTMNKCTQCFELHHSHQLHFPMKPVYHPKPVIAVDTNSLHRQGVQVFTSNVVSELNQVFTSEVDSTFTEALLQCKPLRLEQKKNSSENRHQKRQLHREVTKKIAENFADNAAISMLTEGESMRKYHRKRLSQSFHTPTTPHPVKKAKSHSPNFSNVTWDDERLETTLRNWPSDKFMNWSAVAKEHGVPGKNAGQVVKEFSKLHDFEITTPKRKPTKRPCRKKLHGTDISIPANPAVNCVEAEIRDMISSGRFCLGEECTPYTITNYHMIDGKLSPYNTMVQARKVPLRQIRQRLFTKHLKYMRPISSNINRSLCMWHDHATILKMGFIMVTVHVMYDPLVFFTDAEYQQLHPDTAACVQAEVEQPEVYLLSAGSSSVEDQAALVGDRVSCVLDLKNPIQAESGIQVRL